MILMGCVSRYTGSAQDLPPDEFTREPEWIVAGDVPFVAQEAPSDCGAAALAMVLGYWGRNVGVEDVLRGAGSATEDGILAGDLRDFARSRGLKAYLITADLTDLRHEIEKRRPIVVGMVKPYDGTNLTHFEVVVGMDPSGERIATLDPAHGLRGNTFRGFLSEWQPSGRLALVVFEAVGEAGLRPGTP